jgi:putative two-component system response regulator
MSKIRIASSYRIMVVDDDSMTLELVARFLEAEGYMVTPAIDGKTALFLAATLDIDLILLDITMADMDGFQVLRTLKGDSNTIDIPVVMMTAKTDRSTVEAARGLGAIDYITKPIAPQNLLARLERILAKLRAQSPAASAVAWS